MMQPLKRRDIEAFVTICCLTDSEVSHTVQLVAHVDVLLIFASSPKNCKLLSVA